MKTQSIRNTDSHRDRYLVISGLILATILAYLPIRDNEFVNFDDNGYITENSVVKQGLTLESIGWAFTTGAQTNWHPLTWISHMLDVELYGLNPVGHHATNLLFHILNTVLLFILLHRMSGSVWRGAFVAMAFALHPLHVESVAWAAERKDVLSTFFWMATSLAYVMYVKKPTRMGYALVLAFYMLGLLAKPMLVTLPFVLLLIDYWPLGRFNLVLGGGMRKRGGGSSVPSIWQPGTVALLLKEKIPLFVLAAASSVATYVAQHSGGSVSTLEGLPLGIRVINAIVSYLMYVVKLFWPTDLAPFYPHPLDAIPVWRVAAALVVLVSVTIVVFRVAQRYPYLSTGWFWYVGTLVPVIGLIQVGAQAMADRYTYIPLIGLFMIIAWGVTELLARLRQRKVILTVSAIVIAVVLGISTYRQVQHWQNSKTLFSHAVNVTADNWLAHEHLGYALAVEKRYEEAVEHYETALKFRPFLPDMLRNMAYALSELGRVNEAVEHYQRSLKSKPEYADVHNDLGVLLGKTGRMEEAIKHISEALRLNPDFADAHNNMGIILAIQGKDVEAGKHFEEAIRLSPDHWNALYNLGLIREREGDLAEALVYVSRAVELKPDYAEARKKADEIQRRMSGQR